MTSSEDNNLTEWRELLYRNEGGEVINSINNGVIILTNHPKLKGLIAYNEHAECVYVIGKLPWDKYYSKPRPFNDYDRTCLRLVLETEGLLSVNKLDDVVAISSHRKSYNPIKDTLDGFEYRGEGFIRKLLPEYLGVEDSDYNYEVMKLAMVAGVKRIYEPGCKYDYCIVFQGPQGIGKSTFILRLSINSEWYSDSISVISKGRDAAEQLRRKWIVEIGELSAFKKSENESIKSFLSSQQDSYREAYGHYSKDYPRTCIFFGTTNDIEYLHDDTGNRRILPVLTGVNSPKKSLFDMNQVEEDFGNAWAEALHIYKEAAEKGKDIALILPEEVRNKALELQTIANEEDSWKGAIKDYLVDIIRRESRSIYTSEGIIICKTSAIDIWERALGGTKASCTKAISGRINAIMRDYKDWEYKTTVRFDGYQGRGYQFYIEKNKVSDYIRDFENDSKEREVSENG